MELLSAILTCVFLCLFLANCLRSARKRAQMKAGELILAVENPRRSKGKKIVFVWLTLLPVLLLIPYLILIFHWIAPLSAGYSVNFLQFFQILNATFCLFMPLATCPLLQRNVVEIRRHGLVFIVRFCPWDKIRCCRWNAKRRVLRVQKSFGETFRKITAEEADSIIQTLGRFVVVYDINDTTLAAPPIEVDEAVEAADAARTPKQRFSPFQFDLSSLMLLVLVTAAFFSWFGMRYRQAGEIDKQLTRIQERFAGVNCSQNWVDGNEIFIVSFVGCKSKPGDEALEEISPLSRLEHLYLSLCPITDEGLKRLNSFPQLKTLYLSGTRISDAGLVHLKSLPQLTDLSLDSTAVTDAGLAQLASLGNLRSLSLSMTGVTDAGIMQLKKLEKLEQLTLIGTKVTDEGVKSLQKELPGTRIMGNSTIPAAAAPNPTPSSSNP
jgi:hypothetical protein